MSGEIIRLGDPTSHGGKVLEGSMTEICHGKPIAFIGHKVQCPKCKGTFPIVEGVQTTTIFGKGVAVAGMKTACGATLIATQFTDVIEQGGGGSGAQAASPAAKAATPAAPAAAAAAAGAAALAPAAADKAGDEEETAREKAIRRLYWTYGPDEQPLEDVSRHYVDLNLHVETENYAAGEAVPVVLKNDDGADIVAGSPTLDLQVPVGADGSGKLMNVFKGKTVEIGIIG